MPRLSFWGCWLAGNDDMEQKLETTLMGLKVFRFRV